MTVTRENGETVTPDRTAETSPHCAEKGLFSAVVPFVNTLNDRDVACPVSYYDENNQLCMALEDTPSIANRKDRVRHYLRFLPGRFLDKERLLLSVFCITHNNRNLDCDNVASLIQNSGRKLIWGEDSQIYDVRCQRYVSSWARPETERTIVYVAVLRQSSLDRLSFRSSRHALIRRDYENRYDEEKHLALHFDLMQILTYKQKGFWEDDRFLRIPALKVNYERWLMDHL